MQFRVGPWIYRIRISDAPLVDGEGSPAAALWLWEERVLLISGSIPCNTRIDALVHELRHAWQTHFGRPLDDEGDANNAASFSVDFMRQFLSQGGEAALMRLNCGGIVDDATGPDDLASEPAGAQCAGCGGSFSPAQIVTEPAAYSSASGSLHVVRSLYCDFCGHVQRWTEGATSAGFPNGKIARPPRFIKGEAASEFLRKHGALCGVSGDR